MIDRIIELSIRHRGLVIVAGLALAAWGAYAVSRTPIDAVPDLSENQVLVFAEWPGHSPTEIEEQVTYPLSRTLQSLAGIRAVRGSSEVNFCLIHLIFEDAVDYVEARRRVQERLTGLSGVLPAEVTARVAPEAIPTGQIFWYTVEGPGYDLARLRSVQDWYVRPQLESVAGVAEVASVGGQVLEYHVELDPFRMRDLGVLPGDVLRELARSNAAVGGDVVHKANAEFVVRGVGWLGVGHERAAEPDPSRILRELEGLVVPASGGAAVRLSEVGRVALGAAPRRGILEKDGNEVTGGVVLMRYGENPLEVTERLKEQIGELQAGLPSGVRIVPCYDRTPLIRGAVATVTGTLIEAIVTASVCVVVVLLHLRTAFVIAITLPLSVLAAFVMMWGLRVFGIADIQTNIMSLAGIAISIGVLVDSSIVMAENAMHHLRERFGDEPVRGDVRPVVLAACKSVGRPMLFAILIMLVSFLPVFTLGGIDGKMYRPLALTKTFALVAVAVLTVTLVPALCTVFIRGRLRRETDSWITRSVIEAYRPVLDYLLDRPGPLVWVLGATMVLGAIPLGSRAVLLPVLGAALVLAGWTARAGWTCGAAIGGLLLVALVGEQVMQPLGTELRFPLDERMVMDMPITIPRASSVQSGDDLKARDMVLCRFPEVEMVIGKAGRAESSFDPAPLDMIETMVMLRPEEFWPKRKLREPDAAKQARLVYEGLQAAELIESPGEEAADRILLDEAVSAALFRFDAAMREYCRQRNADFQRALGPLLARFLAERTAVRLASAGSLIRPLGPGDLALVASSAAGHASAHLAMSLPLDEVTTIVRHAEAALAKAGYLDGSDSRSDSRPGPLEQVLAAPRGWLGLPRSSFFTELRDSAQARRDALWAEHIEALNRDLFDRAASWYTRIVAEEVIARASHADPDLTAVLEQVDKARSGATAETDATENRAAGEAAAGGRAPNRAGGHHGDGHGPLPLIDPHPALDSLLSDLAVRFARRLVLWPCGRDELAGSYGGELDRALQMPGWTNVWTMPIQNRVDMLTTGVNTEVGVRVLGKKLEDIVAAADEIAAVLREVQGAADVFADPIRGKGYLEIRPDREACARLNVSVGDVHDVVATALGGVVATTTVEGRERNPVRVRYSREWARDEETVRRLPLPVRGTRRAAEQGDREDRGVPEPVMHTGIPRYVPLQDVASVGVVEGPSAIKSENGLLRTYVRCNVRDRGVLEFVDAARDAVARRVSLPEGTYVEWTGQFEHALETMKTLAVVVPIVAVAILLLLYATYRDWADAGLMLLAVPGAVAGGVIFQWLFGYKFSIAVGVGYLACFGMATATGMIMLVYLREAVDRAGGIDNISMPVLRQAVMTGAVHRLRPKLLTEATTIVGLAPMLWASGIGAEVIRPMAAPVLGGILVADEVIDLLLPVMFYHVRRRRWQKLHAAAFAAAETGQARSSSDSAGPATVARGLPQSAALGIPSP